MQLSLYFLFLGRRPLLEYTGVSWVLSSPKPRRDQTSQNPSIVSHLWSTYTSWTSHGAELSSTPPNPLRHLKPPSLSLCNLCTVIFTLFFLSYAQWPHLSTISCIAPEILDPPPPFSDVQVVLALFCSIGAVRQQPKREDGPQYGTVRRVRLQPLAHCHGLPANQPASGWGDGQNLWGNLC